MQGKTWRRWTDDEERRVEAMRVAGATIAEIAEALGRTFCSVANHVPGLRVRRTPWTTRRRRKAS